jgi:dienelactone hydrolase
MRIRCAVFVACLLCAAGDAAGQAYAAFGAEPPPGVVRVMPDVRFAAVDTTVLAMDVYRPAKTTTPAPAIIFYALFEPQERRPRAENDWLKSWARMAAANGIVGIIPDLRKEPGTGNATGPARARGDDLERAIKHVIENAEQFGVDRERITLFAGSGAVAPALPAVQDPRQGAIKAAVMYYGGAGASVERFRLDLPLLYVRAGLDSPGMNAAIDRLAAAALAQNAPITVINHHTGYHGFEGRNNDDATMPIVLQTIEFVKRATAPSFQAAIRARQLDALAAGQISARNFKAAASTYAEIMKQRPNDASIRVSYASALLADQQYATACTELRQVKPPEYGALLPGTRACVLAGTPDAAIAFLQTMPKDWVRFAAPRLQADSVFAPLWERTDFRALFRQ